MYREARKKQGLSPKLTDKKKKFSGGDNQSNRSNKRLKTMVKGAVSEVIAQLANTVNDKDDSDVSSLLSSISSVTAGSPSNKTKMLASDLVKSITSDKESSPNASVSATSMLGTLRRNIQNKGKSVNK